MIRYFIKVKCSTEGCVNNLNSSSFWYDNPTTSHPCGFCGMMITDCEILDQGEFAPHPPPPPTPGIIPFLEIETNG
jgi:hypothetical protein